MKKLAIFLICFFPVALLFLVFTFRFKPDGGGYFTFLTRAPVVIAGDGSSCQSAYQLRHGRASDLQTSEVETIRTHYKSSSDLAFTNTNLNGHAYDIVTLKLPNETRTVYFDVTAYKSKTQP